MARALVLFAAGIAIGAAGMYFVAHGRSAARNAPIGRLPAARNTAVDNAAAPPPGGLSIAQRRAVYDAVAQADAAALQSRLRDAAADPQSARRRFTLQVLLARYAEIDPAQAIHAARRLGLRPPLWLPVYEAWAERDRRAALAALHGLDEPADAAAAGLAVLRGLGGNEARNVDRVMAALPGDAQRGFVVGAVAAIARTSPADALDLALTLHGESTVRTAVRSAAAIWAERDPRAALAAAASIGDAGTRKRFEEAVLGVWAGEDPEDLLAYAATPGSALQQRVLSNYGLLRSLARTHPQRVLALTDHVSSGFAKAVRSQAVQALARRDPGAAVAYVAALPPSQERQELLRATARGYGQAQPDAALSWARNLDPPDPLAVAGVIAGIAEADPDRALELALAETSPAAKRRALTSIAAGAGYDSAQEARIADRLLAAPGDGASQSALQMLTARWTANNPDDAADWMLANADRLSPAAFAQLAGQLGRKDPQKAVQYTAQIPRRVRAKWIAGLASSYAQVDTPGALSWVAQFRGEPGYADAASSVARQLAQSDPQGAANLLQSIAHPTMGTASTAASIANELAQRDPRGAAQWALSLQGTRTEQLAVSAAVMRWTVRDAPSARSWVLALPPDQNRDFALSSLVTAVARNGTPDQSLFDAFKDDAMRNRAVLAAVSVIARRDAGAARAFANAHLADPKLRRSAEQMIDGLASNSFLIGTAVGQSPPVD